MHAKKGWKMFRVLGKLWGGIGLAQRCVGMILTTALLALALSCSAVACAQVVPSGDEGGMSIAAGAMGAGSYVQYGESKMLGLTGFVDVNTHRRLGIEAEGKWLEWRQNNDVHIETYSIGGRYRFSFGRWVPYAKGLVGFGHFNFPYNLATGSYLVVTGGAGVDLRLSRRISWRVADIEYQDWPQFTFGNMTTTSVSTGIKVGIY
jgi:Outer membrane protein beta-barrel domain